MKYDYLVVGAGLAGCTVAERLATQLDASVLVVDRRPHIAGNAYDEIDRAGLRVHRYGPHIFHTNSADVVGYLSRFTAWRIYEHRVLARIGDKLVPLPIGAATLRALYGVELDEMQTAQEFARRAEPAKRVLTSEDAIVSKIGVELYELFFRGYTRKQWSLDPSQLDASVCGRIPVRFNHDDRYFTDRFQLMPAAGYTAMCARMLDHPRIEVQTGVDFVDAADRVRFDRIVYTGPIDEYFERRFGPLPYRSLRFEFETLDCPRYQPVAVVNEPDERVPYTRTTEFKHLTGQAHARTTIVREYPAEGGEPYYPVPRPDNRALYARYAKLAGLETNVTFVGRLAQYKYLNMDQVVAAALRTFEALAHDAGEQIA
ncbi:MAG: UDP-galactopyranose mutase [Vulcanimicrobiaceae bacterium]